ncbi:hypothetical protein MNBD_NITROSPINAE03-1661 [hydrothermal vent metagenome]|uniref:Uncharacterized protein n=1 Tax=hydrothermal vent metagenome TaxID=652676 RepID=A0A3B1CA60_9ZZZZ
MKCPHCKYVSFEYLDTCRKCSKDLKAHKSQHGIDYMAPISLGILTFVDTGSAPAGAPVSDEMSFDTSDLVIGDEESQEEGGTMDFGADAPDEEVEFSVDESFEEDVESEVMIEEVAEDAGVAEIEMGEAEAEVGEAEIEMGEAEVEMGEAEVEIGEAAEAMDEEPVFEVGSMEDSDTGFSLGLGDDLEGDGEGLDFGSMDSDSGAGEEIGLGLDDSGAQGEEAISLSIGDQEPSSELEMNLVAEPEGEEASQTAAPKEGDEFPDIELSLDDEELFGEDGESDEDLDLSGLDLELNDD